MSLIVPCENGQPRREALYLLPPHGSFGLPFYANLHVPQRPPIPPLMEQMLPSPRCFENQPKIQSDDFLSFLENKAKPMSELNPFATEFSLPKTPPEPTVDTTPTKDSLSYRLIFNDLVEKSLQSIDVITKAAK